VHALAPSFVSRALAFPQKQSLHTFKVSFASSAALGPRILERQRHRSDKWINAIASFWSRDF
jgi:hypothetical protein